MSDRQLMNIQQAKIKEQNRDIDEIIGHVKMGNEMTLATKDELTKQNKLLDDVDRDVMAFNLDGSCSGWNE